MDGLTEEMEVDTNPVVSTTREEKKACADGKQSTVRHMWDVANDRDDVRIRNETTAGKYMNAGGVVW